LTGRLSDLTFDALRRAPLEGLEALYAARGPVFVPRGVFRGVFLTRVESAGAERLGNRLMMKLGFELPRFGIDFERRLWTFGHPRLAAGRFEPRGERSRWRDADVVALHYGVSRLPRWVRRRLYDEVKPLTSDLGPRPRPRRRQRRARRRRPLLLRVAVDRHDVTRAAFK
jgi:hypothetical protein